MLRTRLWMGTALVLALAGGLWLDERLVWKLPPWIPPYPCWLVFAILVVAGCCYELRQLLHHRGIRTSLILSYGSVLGVIAANWVPWLLPANGPAERLAWPAGVACAAVMIVLIRETIVFREPGHAVTSAGASMLMIFYLGVLGTFLVQLRWLNHGWLALAAQVAAAKCGDSGAYFAGRAFGRHKLCPWLSPNKTVEGAVGGVIASVVGVLAVLTIGAKVIKAPLPPLWVTVPFGLAVGPLAQIGDLIESLIKRDCQQKDASDLLPGFGGALDVMDSLLFSAPLAFVLWIWLGFGWGAGLQSAIR